MKNKKESLAKINHIRNLLGEICNYYEVTRQCGHTAAMLNGVNNTPEAKIAICNLSMVNRIKNMTKKLLRDDNFVTISSTAAFSRNVRGSTSPLVFDNAALYTICRDSLNAINAMEDLSSNKK